MAPIRVSGLNDAPTMMLRPFCDSSQPNTVCIGDLEPGSTTRFEVRVPYRQLGISGAEGVYPVGVEILGTDVDGTRGTAAIRRDEPDVRGEHLVRQGLGNRAVARVRAQHRRDVAPDEAAPLV